MKIALIYGQWSLSFRKDFTFKELKDDPRGLSGSELAFIRLADCLSFPGNTVELFTVATDQPEAYPVRPLSELDQIDESYDVALVINEPDLLRHTKARLKVCYHLINSFEFLADAPYHVDLWLSPSEPHRQMILGQPHNVGEVVGGTLGTWQAEAKNWKTVHLGCDPPELGKVEKVPGRVIYTSSPDRGLHWLLQEWPAIRKAVPHAHLKIFYRLEPWLKQWETTGYYAPIERLRRRALYIGDALRRLQGHGVEVVDSVSRNQIQREMLEAEVMAYPCDPVRWTEGFSCSILEGCAAQACPVVMWADALGPLYGAHIPVTPKGDLEQWRETVIKCLRDPAHRFVVNTKARKLAETMTWADTARGVLAAIEEKLCS